VGCMTQLRGLRTRPVDSRVHRELSVISDRRAAPAPGATVHRPPLLRPVRAEDRGAIADMAARCSDDTLRRRFHAPVAHLTLERVAQLLTGAEAVGVVVAELDGSVVAVGTLHRDGRGDGEMAVIVEDAWQSTGLGSRMTAALFDTARTAGVPVIVADVLREPRFLMDRLQRHNPTATVTVDGPVATIRMPVLSA
jgi:N-acetylglutamate synthase-like GNAT family acetyltransferase